ncbi:MAG: S8 family serine peptidase, partial [Gemmatimonadetes bacterium]|nr:S8 family serine peptidase [Gemmatimonadota bacterium]
MRWRAASRAAGGVEARARALLPHPRGGRAGRRPSGELVQAVVCAARRGPLLTGAARLCVDSPAVRDLRGQGVTVAVIDSGVNGGHPHVGAVAGGVRIELSGEVSEDYVDRLGHGTAVFAAIQEKAPGAELYAVRVFTDRLKTSARALVAAIDWAAERRVRVVNLSLGTLREEHAAMLEG